MATIRIQNIYFKAFALTIINRRNNVLFYAPNVCSEKKNTKRSCVSLLRLVFFFSEQTLHFHELLMKQSSQNTLGKVDKVIL